MGDWAVHHLHGMHPFLRHRGPDDIGIYHEPCQRVGLIHTRLSIIDLMGGQQPLRNEDGTVVVIFNGEIYNHSELRHELKGKGHNLSTESDGEVIAHLYEEVGIDFVQRLRGMFAIALWDQRQRSLFLIRDRFGIKPLYYRESSRGLLFASEAKAILAVERVRDIDLQALDWYLSFRYVPEDRTLFDGIRKLRPGHWMRIDHQGVHTHRYWDLRNSEPTVFQDERQWSRELRERLREAVDIRLMSDVPLGAFLSGGLDSSSIVGLMAELSDRPVETFSFGVGEGWHNETEYADVAATAFQTSHHALHDNCDEPDTLRKAIWHLDEPLADTAIIPTYLLSELTRRHVTVALTGEGADELLGGYDKYKLLVGGDRIGAWLPKGATSGAARLLSAWHKPYRALRFLSQTGDRARAYMELMNVFSQREKQTLLQSELADKLARKEPASAVIQRILDGCRGPTYLDDLIHIDLQTWLVDDVLLKADKMSMAHGLEARVPFLDHEFAEFCASIPASLKLKRWREKHILREAMRDTVPERIVRRKKHGFTVSLVPWAEGGERSTLRTVLSKDNVEKRGWLNYAVVDRLLRGNLENPFIRRQVFTILVLELWAQVFLDPPVLGALPATT